MLTASSLPQAELDGGQRALGRPQDVEMTDLPTQHAVVVEVPVGEQPTTSRAQSQLPAVQLEEREVTPTFGLQPPTGDTPMESPRCREGKEVILESDEVSPDYGPPFTRCYSEPPQASTTVTASMVAPSAEDLMDRLDVRDEVAGSIHSLALA